MGITHQVEEKGESKVKCVACAEVILAEAKLCKHCGTLQDDARFNTPLKEEENQSIEKTVEKPVCIRCLKKLQVSDHSLCVECIEDLDDFESVVFQKGRNISLCPKCELFIFDKGQSTFCHVCTREAEPQTSNLWISWWAQILFVLGSFALPDTFSDVRVFIYNVSAQVFGWNVLLSLAFGIAVFARRRRAKRHRVISWLYSSLTFGSIALFFVIFIVLLVTS